MEENDVTFSEVDYKLPHGPTVSAAGAVPFPTMAAAITAVKQTAIDLWLDKAAR